MPTYTNLTKEIRHDHSYWKCNQALNDGSTCSGYNDIKCNACKDCKSRRGAGDDGTDEFGNTIAKLVFVNKMGEEHWGYLDQQ
ncbi:hypothetical protein F66182_9679 [Fusarium sp. NRRL 66182]|nr:hypothetical protein F66182_9679 [Fusarium sp. NRRL 66182]